MTSITFFFIFIPLLAVILLAINLIFAPHNPYQEKDSAFECGFHSFLGQNRTQFSISFFIFALLFLLFDLEIILIYPYAVSAYANHIYGLIIMLVFFVILTLGFAFELGKNALKIDSRQTFTFTRKQSDITTLMSGMQNYFKTIKSRSLRRFSTSPILKANDNNKEDINKPSSISSTNENNNNENLNSPSPMSSTEYEAETERVDYDPKT
jgi:NADH-ubiquinone oxidoreductase chain 3